MWKQRPTHEHQLLSLCLKTILVPHNRFFEQLTFNDYILLESGEVPELSLDCDVVDDDATDDGATITYPCSNMYIVPNLQAFGEYVC